MNELYIQLLKAYGAIAFAFTIIFMAWQAIEIGKLGPIMGKHATVRVWACVGKGLAWPLMLVTLIVIALYFAVEMVVNHFRK